MTKTVPKANMHIQQRSHYVKQLLEDAAQGLILPAGFQRPYVWTQADVISLMESILKGYPIGSLLTWEPRQKADAQKLSRSRLGPIAPADDKKPYALILDGQNRLATLAWVLHGDKLSDPSSLTDHERQVWQSGTVLAVDIESRSVAFVPPEATQSGFCFPAGVLVDRTLSNELLRSRWSTDYADVEDSQLNEAIRWLDKAQDAFSDAQVIVTILCSATPEEARDAFRHICKVGVPMSEEDLQASLGWKDPAP